MATRTQVAIIGGGPAGLLLSHMLHRNGIDSIVLERQSRAHVLGRIRAGVLEAGTVELLREVGLGARMDREGHPHNGSAIAWEGRPRFFIDTKKFTGKTMMAYGQPSRSESCMQSPGVSSELRWASSSSKVKGMAFIALGGLSGDGECW